MQTQFKVADSIAVDDEGYAVGLLSAIEFDQYLNEETGEVKDQIVFVWQTQTRKGIDSKLRLWTGINITPTPRMSNGKKFFNALTQILLIHKIITSEDLKKLAQDEEYINELDIDLGLMVGETHKFKLNINERGLARPDISSLRIVKPISIRITSTSNTESEELEQ
ncbi:MAG: hypothetical protein KME28_27430 [Pelatocladus maniniholoensis HA4357-MV3]|jgi:hypothetical protein|uniref:Uncharacterized protein n=1 Tax=Pelatocladus maniniholoensis HA4357-MV3 TaxID=1117104 RepID=A0A9E3HDD1_9NOST|nr:hypothetical protein [Pelatocladus maniniholoensis HA4357-MV3]